MKKRIVLSRGGLFILIAGCVFTSWLLLNVVHQVWAKEASIVDRYQRLKSFTDVLALVENNYVEPVDMDELVEGAIKGMLLTLDPHTGYLNRDLFKELQVETKGEFGGLGIEITVKDGFLTVVAPIEDSPAFRAGIEAGDKIIKIDDDYSKDMSLVEAVKKMRGKKGTPITISVQRERVKDLLPITIIRDVIKVKSVRFRPLDEGFGYVRLAQFQEESSEEFIKALDKMTATAAENKLQGLVIDLRNNPGGLLTQAIRVSDIFLKDGVIVYTEGRLESQRQKHFAHDDGTEPDYPIVILINGGSASASEIVAGAMQDHGRAVILGEQSFGKGSVQTILPMEEGDALRLTTALYFTKSGRSIQAQGISPDVDVPDKRFLGDAEESLEDEKESKEPAESIKEKDLPGALKNPSEKDKKKKAEQKAKAEEAERVRIGSRKAMKVELSELLKEDPQLEEALRLLKTWKVFRGRPVVEASDEKNKAVAPGSV